MKRADKTQIDTSEHSGSRSLTLKASPRQTLGMADKDLMSSLESSQSVTAINSARVTREQVQFSQPSGHQCNSLCLEAHYIPLLLSQNFVDITSRMEKEYGIHIFSTTTCEMNNIIKQVIFRSSSSHLITIQLCYCNLIYEQVDAIVNCSQELSGELQAIGGQVLQLQWDNYISSHQAQAATSVATCLESGSLPCKRIVHVVSHLEDETGEESSCLIQKALKCAQKYHLRTISFPSTGGDTLTPEQLVHDIQKFFILNPESCVHVVRIVCSSDKLMNAYCGIKEFNHEEVIVDLPKLASLKPLSYSSTIQGYCNCQWYWQADDDTFIPYSKAINTTLTCEYKICHTGRCYFQVGSNLYIANFERMEQSNASTRFIRKMKVEYINTSSHANITCSNKSSLLVNAQWFYFTCEGEESSPCSTADSGVIENLYISSAQSLTLRQGSKKFSLDLKAMRKQALQLGLPSEAACIERKVVVSRPKVLSSQQHLRFAPKWYYMGDTKKFVPYSKQDSVSIEGMYQNKTASTLSVQSRVYTFDFNDMKRINTATGYKRSIKRVSRSTTDIPILSTETVPLHHISRGVVVNIEGPPTILEKVSDELEAKVKCMLYTSELPLPSAVSGSLRYQKRIMNVAKKHNILCSFSRRTATTMHTTASNGESEVLTLSGAENLIQIAIKEIMEEITLIASGRQGNSAATVSPDYQVPTEWQPQTQNTQLFELSESTDEYCHIKSMFQLTMPNSVIVSIKRIQNNWLWERYVLTRKRLSKKNNGRVNEKELFHGSRSSRAHLIYDSEEGFDMRYSSEGMWGQANYFAVKASYSNSYAYELGGGTREILLAKVLTGDSYKCSSDRTLRMPPVKYGQTRFQQERYDTVEGETSGSTVYMTYSNDKAYPAYLIVYIPNSNKYGGMQQSLSSQHVAAQVPISTSPWSYNLTTSSTSAHSNSASLSAAAAARGGASHSVNPGTNYQARPPRPTNPSTAYHKTTPHAPKTTSDKKNCILQ